MREWEEDEQTALLVVVEDESKRGLGCYGRRAWQKKGQLARDILIP